MRYTYITILLVVSIALSGCKEEVFEYDKNQNLGYDYYPLVPGKHIVYNIETITIDAPVGRFDTLRYQLKEQVTGTCGETSNGEISYRMERFTRYGRDSVWRIKDVWMLRKSASKLVRVEENTPIVKQAYPLKVKQKWDAHQYCSLQKKEFVVTYIDKADTIGSMVFDNTMEIRELYDENLFEKQYEVSKYARGIGMVYRQVMNVESQTSSTITIDISKPILDRITVGTIETWIVHSHSF